MTSKSAAQRWGAAREAALLAAGREAYEATKKGEAVRRYAVPTLAEFWPRVLQDHYRASRKKPSTIDAAQSIYACHLAPAFGALALDAITTAEIARFKGAHADAAPKTVNNMLTVLSRSLRCAVEWGVLREMPCAVGFFKIADEPMAWYERHEYRRLVDAARLCGLGHHIMVLLAGSAGLRRGEVRALKWSDIDFERRTLYVGRALWRQHEATPKGNRGRAVPLTDELYDALRAYRHLKGDRVLYTRDGRELSNRSIRNMLAGAQRRANLEADGGIHILRHTFCSHLAAAGVPAKAIQELAGHADLKTMLRYMHLSPDNRSEAMTALARYHAGDGERKERRMG